MGLFVFNLEVYVHSVDLSDKQLAEEAFRLSKVGQIYRLKFSHMSSVKDKVPHFMHAEVGKFLESVILYYEDKFKERSVKAELNCDRSYVNIIGNKPADLMMAKTTMKNALESLVCLIFRNVGMEKEGEGRLREYLGNLSKYPICHSRLSKEKHVLIGKDNIVRQLLEKPEKLKRIMVITEDS